MKQNAIKLEQARIKNEAEFKAKCLAMMRDPNRWSAWPILPLVKYDPSKSKIDGESGFIIENPGVKHTVFKGNVFSLPEDFTTLPQEKFESFEAMVEAGWRVD
ncbi:MAG: hypothetical protein V1767_01125 [Chloroflexota bacterium]